ncbi:MAG TPA: dTMP kinase [Anaerolineales bacterium]|nr:dTMP kinase [Anaerolineales bacterium]
MFITLEGPDGSGKTTQMKALAEALRERGRAVYTTREPGGTGIGDQIRRVLLDLANEGMVARTEILLFLASRAQHTEEVIRPRLAAGEIVICDRYRDSTVAYQGYGRGVDIQTLHKLNDFATGGLLPDLTILLDVSAETGLARRASDGSWNRLDADAVDFHRRVQAGYHAMAEAEPERWRVVDANREVEGVQAALIEIVTGRLG